MAGVLAGLSFAWAQNHDVPWLAVTGALLLALVGLADDQGTVRAAPRLGAQIAMGALVGTSVGGGWWGLVVDDQIGGLRIRLGIAELTNPVIAP
jgi:UDP-N-acetylmuramyl pentapeptide phosphotransferase/UDP-N-acetylglucosamine-1-phosphate transferase